MPPFVGVAVNVAELPAHIVVLGVLILTEGVTVGLMVMVMAFDVAGLPVTPPRFEVMTHVTTEPVARVVVVKVADVAPLTAVPFTFH